MSEEAKPQSSPRIQEFQGERSRKLLKCSTDATAHMKEHFRRIREKMTEGEPVIWTYQGIPWELFNAMDILYLDSVYYGSLCSAKQMSRYYLDALNSRSYFRDLCRYCTVSLGVAFDNKPQVAPWGGLPKFAAAVHLHQDDPSVKIWELYAREFDIPLYTIDRPYPTRFPPTEEWWKDTREADAELIEPHRLNMMIEELEGLIRFLETTIGKHLSLTKLREAMERRNQELETYWKATDLACKAVPFPIGFTDTASNIAAVMYFPGTQWAVDHARKYYEEVKERVDKGEGVCQNERVRLYWIGITPWFSPGFFNTWEEKYGAVFLPNGYFPMEGESLRRNLGDPLRTLASHIANGWVIVRIPTFRNPFDINVAKKYKIDGAVIMSAESCKTIFCSDLFVREALERAGIPTVAIYADMVDSRDWDDSKMKSVVTDLVETLLP